MFEWLRIRFSYFMAYQIAAFFALYDPKGADEAMLKAITGQIEADKEAPSESHTYSKWL